MSNHKQVKLPESALIGGKIKESTFWFCEVCGQQRYTKKALVKHLKDTHRIDIYDGIVEEEGRIYKRRAHVR